MTEQDWIEEIINSTESNVKGIPVLETINVSQMNRDAQQVHDLRNKTLNNLNLITEETTIQKTLKVVDKRAELDSLSESFLEKNTQEVIGTRQASFKETLSIHINQVSNLLNAFA